MFVGNKDKVYIIDKAEGNAAQINGHPAWGAVWCDLILSESSRRTQSLEQGFQYARDPAYGYQDQRFLRFWYAFT